MIGGAELQLRKRPYLADSGMQFLQKMSSHRQEQQNISLKELKIRIDKICQKLRGLDRNEQSEWSNFYQKKITHLWRGVEQSIGETGSREKVMQRALKQHLRILIFVCSQLQLKYNENQINEILRRLYFKEYGEEIFREFEAVGFPTNDLRVLSYNQSYFSGFGLCCCLSEPDEE